MVDVRLSEAEVDRRIERISAFINAQCKTAGADGVVLGLSGGIDSATTAAIASRAVGPNRVKPVLMPAEPTSSASIELANELAAAFDLEVVEISIESIVHEVMEAYAKPARQEAIGNVRARTRAVVWYLIANEENRLVLGGGNRAEWLTGYFTKHGDIAVDCLPLGNLYKAQVRQVATRLGVPDAIVDRPPSAELWRGQTDEGELGISYDVLDGILAGHIDGDLDLLTTAEKVDVAPAVVERVVSLVETSEHKRRLPAVPQSE